MAPSTAVYGDPGFESLLAGFKRQTLDDGPEVIYGVWADLTLAYTNAAYRRFAAENDGADALARYPIGSSIRPVFGEALGPFYEQGFTQALATDTPWEHTYACPSADQARWFRLRALPLGNRGLLITHTLVASGPAGNEARGARLDAYRNADGFITQCCHCRRVRLPDRPQIWHFVPAFVANMPPEASHGLCPLCLSYHYHRLLSPEELQEALASAEPGSSTTAQPRSG